MGCVLLGDLKDKLFNTNPPTTDNMNEAAQEEMFALTTKYLQGAIRNAVILLRHVTWQWLQHIANFSYVYSHFK